MPDLKPRTFKPTKPSTHQSTNPSKTPQTNNPSTNQTNNQNIHQRNSVIQPDLPHHTIHTEYDFDIDYLRPEYRLPIRISILNRYTDNLVN